MAGAFREAVLASSNVPGRGTVAVVEVRSGKVKTGDNLMIAGGTDGVLRRWPPSKCSRRTRRIWPRAR